MQFDTLRAFPYPVLRPDIDDYVDGDIQVTVDFEPTAEGVEVTAKVSFTVSVPEIEDLVAKGKAVYAIVFACRDTYYRHVEKVDHADFHVKFPPGYLRGEVQVFPYITTVEKIEDYESALINPEFGDGPFTFEIGSVLAVDRPQAVYIDKDVFRPLTSLFELVKNDYITGYEWRVDASNDKVCIQVIDALKTKIDAARNTSQNKAILLNSIYFAAVMHCIETIKAGEAPEKRWAEIIEQKIHNAGIDLASHDTYLVAEKLMQFPFKLVDTYVFAGEDG
jgi:hypothetical protein